MSNASKSKSKQSVSRNIGSPSARGDAGSGAGAGTDAGLGDGPRDLDQQVERQVERLASEIAHAQHISYARARGRAARRLGKSAAAAEPGAAAEDSPPQADAVGPEISQPLDFSTVEAPTKAPRLGRAPRVSKAQLEAESRSAAAAAKAKSDAANQAAMLLLMLDSLAASSAGEDARLNAIERTMIEPALANMLARMDASKIEMVSRYTDPIMLLAGGSLWFMRMRQIQKERRGHNDDGTPPPPLSPDSPPGGSDGHLQAEQTQALAAMRLHQQVTDFLNDPNRRP